jgi:hypothetical protein
MLHHTAFCSTITTRFLLLKAATNCQELSSFLDLSDEQLDQVQQLEVVNENAWFALDNVDQNAQPDEQLVDPKFFDFLQEDQLKRLDFVAFWFDGYASLSRSSVASRLNLSAETQRRIAEAILDIRSRVVLPNSRSRFAGPQPKDGDYMDCYFAGTVCAQLNLQIIDILSDEECRQLHEFLYLTYDATTAGDAIYAVRKRAKLPGGVLSLADPFDPADDDPTAHWPKDAAKLVQHLNEWNQSQLILYNEPERFPGRVASDETGPWIEAHKEKLAKLGVEIEWDRTQRKYVAPWR